MQTVERLKILFLLVVLVSSSLLILSPVAHGQGSSSLSSSVELKSGKLNGVWTSGSEYYKIKSWYDGLMKVPFGIYHKLPINNNSSTTDINNFLCNIASAAPFATNSSSGAPEGRP